MASIAAQWNLSLDNPNYDEQLLSHVAEIPQLLQSLTSKLLTFKPIIRYFCAFGSVLNGTPAELPTLQTLLQDESKLSEALQDRSQRQQVVNEVLCLGAFARTRSCSQEHLLLDSFSEEVIGKDADVW